MKSSPLKSPLTLPTGRQALFAKEGNTDWIIIHKNIILMPHLAGGALH